MLVVKLTDLIVDDKTLCLPVQFFKTFFELLNHRRVCQSPLALFLAERLIDYLHLLQDGSLLFILSAPEGAGPLKSHMLKKMSHAGHPSFFMNRTHSVSHVQSNNGCLVAFRHQHFHSIFKPVLQDPFGQANLLTRMVYLHPCQGPVGRQGVYPNRID